MGLLDTHHCNFHDFETRHYNSPNWAGAITILLEFEIRHCLRSMPSWTHCQGYRRPPYLRMDLSALPRKDNVPTPAVI